MTRVQCPSCAARLGLRARAARQSWHPARARCRADGGGERACHCSASAASLTFWAARVGGSLLACSACSSRFSCLDAWSSLLAMLFWSFPSRFKCEFSVPCSCEGRVSLGSGPPCVRWSAPELGDGKQGWRRGRSCEQASGAVCGHALDSQVHQCLAFCRHCDGCVSVVRGGEVVGGRRWLGEQERLRRSQAKKGPYHP